MHPANENQRARADRQIAEGRKPLKKREFFAPISLTCRARSSTQIGRMMQKLAGFRSFSGVRAVVLAHFGAGLLLLALAGCGGTSATTDASGGSDSGGSASGGSDGDGADGSATGGAASGGSGAGGSASGGSASGGADGTGGITACPGVEQNSQSYPPCREQSDCTAGFCQETAPTGDGLCGACFASPMECATDPDCEDGSVCEPGPEMPCQCMGPGLVCAPACTSDSCGEGLVCAEDGHCVAASCASDGYVCPEGSVCDPARPDYPHGCAPAYCDVDGFTCPDDLVCDPAREGNVHRCAPRRCDTEGYTCPSGSVCEPDSPAADAHRCRILHCSEGVECAANFDCDADAGGSGCVQRTCSSDDECDCGACAMDRCEEQLFMCVTLPS